MAFVNEWISKEDIEKCGLRDLHSRYQSDLLIGPYTAIFDPDYRPNWTIDRDKETWLMSVATPTDPDFGDYPKASIDERIFVLYSKGDYIEARLKRVAISLDPTEVPFKAAWKYMGIRPINTEELDEKKMKKILQEALGVYKEFGINKRPQVTEIELIGFEGER